MIFKRGRGSLPRFQYAENQKRYRRELQEKNVKIRHGHLAGKPLADVLEADLMEAVSSMGEEWEGGKTDLSVAA